MCNVSGKVMRDDNLKRHVISVHVTTKNSVQCKEERLQPNNLLMVTQHYNKLQVEGSEIDESDYLLLNNGENLKFELKRNNEVYQKNTDIGEQNSMLLESEIIREKSLSKQNKLCLDLSRAQQPTTNVQNTKLRLWQEQLLDIIKENPINYRKFVRKSPCSSF